MKNIAVVASGWHFSYHFYSSISQQILPPGWKMDMFCISHRNPTFSAEEKIKSTLTGDRSHLDLKLYDRIAYETDISQLGWIYKEYDNTIGDWGCSNQWLEEFDYGDYDLILFTHDDNLILSLTWFNDMIASAEAENWEIYTNSSGAPIGWLRGSCEFFKPSLLDKIGGKFDLSKVSLNRVGKVYGSIDIAELSDWNNTVDPLMSFIRSNNIPVKFGSEYYRVSKYCLEGERGFISKTTHSNTESENSGLVSVGLI